MDSPCEAGFIPDLDLITAIYVTVFNTFQLTKTHNGTNVFILATSRNDTLISKHNSILSYTWDIFVDTLDKLCLNIFFFGVFFV